MTWTKVTKASGTSWTKLTKATKSWTKVTKASGTSWTSIPKATIPGAGGAITPGQPIGLLLALTYATSSSGGGTAGTSWSTISKATGTSWTKLAKAT